MWIWLMVGSSGASGFWNTSLPVTVVPPLVPANGTTLQQTSDALDRAVASWQALRCTGDLVIEVADPQDVGKTIELDEDGRVFVTTDDPSELLDAGYVVATESYGGLWSGTIALDDDEVFAPDLSSCDDQYELQGLFTRALGRPLERNATRGARLSPYKPARRLRTSSIPPSVAVRRCAGPPGCPAPW